MYILVSFFIAMLTVLPASAASKTKCQRTYYISVDSIIPVSYRDPQGHIIGVAHDLASELEKRSGCKFSVMEKSNREMWRDLEKSHTDMTLLNVETTNPEVIRISKFIPMFNSSRSFIVRSAYLQDKNAIYGLIKNSKSKFVGLIGLPLFYTPEEIKYLRANGRYIETVDIAAALNLILNKRADVLILSPELARTNLTHPGLTFYNDDKETRKIGVYLSLPRLNDDERKLIEDLLMEIKHDGVLEKMIQKHTI